MMLAGEPVPRRVAQDLAHHALQGVLHQEVVADQIFGGHPVSSEHTVAGNESGGFCCQVPPNPA